MKQVIAKNERARLSCQKFATNNKSVSKSSRFLLNSVFDLHPKIGTIT